MNFNLFFTNIINLNSSEATLEEHLANKVESNNKILFIRTEYFSGVLLKEETELFLKWIQAHFGCIKSQSIKKWNDFF